jgi:hypothetical protein
MLCKLDIYFYKDVQFFIVGYDEECGLEIIVFMKFHWMK